MQKILVDSGPLVALFDKDDDSHLKVVSFLKTYKGSLISTWPVMTEVSHLLDFSVTAQTDFLKWVHQGGILLEQIEMTDLEQVIVMMLKYHDRPMDLADASLVLLAGRLNIRQILTLDSDFSIYRLGRQKSFVNILKNH